MGVLETLLGMRTACGQRELFASGPLNYQRYEHGMGDMDG
jgi:hypothetical protein